MASSGVWNSNGIARYQSKSADVLPPAFGPGIWINVSINMEEAMREPSEEELHVFHKEHFSGICMMLFENIGEYVVENPLVAKHEELVALAETACQALFELNTRVLMTDYEGPASKPHLRSIEQLISQIGSNSSDGV